MLLIDNLITVIEASVPYTYYANDFPESAPDNAAYVRIEGGFPPSSWTSLKRPSFQVLLRGAEDSGPDLEAKAVAIYQAFHNRNDFLVGPVRIVHCTAEQSAPMFIGRDENERPMYSVNFTVTHL